jgi:hypothetical protein
LASGLAWTIKQPGAESLQPIFRDALRQVRP